MAVVKLPLRRYLSHKIGPHTIYLERVVVLFRLLGRQTPAILRESILDTGAPMTVFPQKEWQRFTQDIRWLTRASDASLPKWCKQLSGVSGGTIPCRLGRVAIEIFDHEGGRLGPIEIMAMFAFDNGRMKDILLGLGGGCFNHRRLEMIYDTGTIELSGI